MVIKLLPDDHITLNSIFIHLLAIKHGWQRAGGEERRKTQDKVYLKAFFLYFI